MREIFQLVLTNGTLPAVGSDDAERLYRTSFLESSQPSTPVSAKEVTTTVATAGAKVPSPVQHQRAQCRVEQHVAAAVKSLATAVAQASPAAVEEAMTLFARAGRVSAWADREYGRLAALYADSFVVTKPKPTAAPAPPPAAAEEPANNDAAASTAATPDDQCFTDAGVADIYAVRDERRALAAQNRDLVAAAVIDGIWHAAAATPDDPAVTASDNSENGGGIAVLVRAAKAFQVDGLGTYRNSLEAPLLQRLERLRAAGGRLLTHTPECPVAAAEQFLRSGAIVAKVLHATSVAPVLSYFADELFPPVTLAEGATDPGQSRLAQAVRGLVPRLLQEQRHEEVKALLLPSRKREWHRAVVDAVAQHLVHVAGGLDGTALRRPDRALLQGAAPLRTMKCSPIPRDALLEATARVLNAGASTTWRDLAVVVERAAGSGAFGHFEATLGPLIGELRPKLDVAGFGGALENAALRRALASDTTSALPDAAERAIAAFATRAVGGDHYCRASRMLPDAALSRIVQARFATLSDAPVTFRCLSEWWLRDACGSAALLAVPVPVALQEDWGLLGAIYLDAEPRRRVQLVPHLSRVTLRWRNDDAASTTNDAEVVMPVCHFTVLEAVVKHCTGGDEDAHARCPLRDVLKQASVDFGVGMYCARDLAAAGVLVLEAADTEQPMAAVPLRPPAQRVHVRFGQHATPPASAAKANPDDPVLIPRTHRLGRVPQNADECGPRCTARDERSRRWALDSAVMSALKRDGASSLQQLLACPAVGALPFLPSVRELAACLRGLAKREFVVFDEATGDAAYLP